jgi:hypothetical protein
MIIVCLRINDSGYGGYTPHPNIDGGVKGVYLLHKHILFTSRINTYFPFSKLSLKIVYFSLWAKKFLAISGQGGYDQRMKKGVGI